VDHPPSSDGDVTRLRTKQAWQRHIRAPGTTRETYCQARHQVAAWTARSGDAWPAALVGLMIAVANGTPFDTAVAL
jgi:hypothetical protein